MKLLDQIMLLPDDEKLILVDQILKAVSEEKKEYSVSNDVVSLVEERIARYKKNPSSVLSFDQFKSQLRQRLY